MKEVVIQHKVERSLQIWRQKEKTALELLRIIGELRFDRSIDLVLFRRDLYDTRPSEIIHHHKHAKNYVNKPITVDMSLSLAQAIAKIDLPPARIDLGMLALNWLSEETTYTPDIDKFVRRELSDFLINIPEDLKAKDVVLYGFGRIGRLLTRRIVALTGGGEQLRLKAIVIRPKMNDRLAELEKRISLLRLDSVHGEFNGTIDISDDETELIINGNRIQVIFANHPSEIDYTTYGIDDALVIDNTGAWRDKEGLSEHLRPGVSKVLLTAPSKDLPNVVYGVNHEVIEVEDSIISAASCTTNAIVPVLKVLNDTFEIQSGHIESIHAYTNSQNLLDNFHTKPRRGRAAAINMVITTTGAATAVSKALPELAGKLTGNAVRVPTPNVSLAIMHLELNEATSIEVVNKALKDASLHGDLVEQIFYSHYEDCVSSDVTGSTCPAYFDAPSTIVSPDGKRVTLYVWYDNEFGYTCQVVRLAKHFAKVRRAIYY